MKASYITPVYLIILLTILAFAASAAEWSGTIHLKIAADEDLKDQISSYFMREIRSLHDVKMVYDENVWANYDVNIVALTAKDTTDKFKLGFVVSVEVLENFDTNIWEAFQFTGRYLTNACLITKSLSRPVRHCAYLFSREGLKDGVAEVVTDIDNNCFETDRKINQQYQEFLKKQDSKTDVSVKDSLKSTN